MIDDDDDDGDDYSNIIEESCNNDARSSRLAELSEAWTTTEDGGTLLFAATQEPILQAAATSELVLENSKNSKGVVFHDELGSFRLRKVAGTFGVFDCAMVVVGFFWFVTIYRRRLEIRGWLLSTVDRKEWISKKRRKKRSEWILAGYYYLQTDDSTTSTAVATDRKHHSHHHQQQWHSVVAKSTNPSSRSEPVLLSEPDVAKTMRKDENNNDVDCSDEQPTMSSPSTTTKKVSLFQTATTAPKDSLQHNPEEHDTENKEDAFRATETTPTGSTTASPSDPDIPSPSPRHRLSTRMQTDHNNMNRLAHQRRQPHRVEVDASMGSMLSCRGGGVTSEEEVFATDHSKNQPVVAAWFFGGLSAADAAMPHWLLLQQPHPNCQTHSHRHDRHHHHHRHHYNWYSNLKEARNQAWNTLAWVTKYTLIGMSLVWIAWLMRLFRSRDTSWDLTVWEPVVDLICPIPKETGHMGSSKAASFMSTIFTAYQIPTPSIHWLSHCCWRTIVVNALALGLLRWLFVPDVVLAWLSMVGLMVASFWWLVGESPWWPMGIVATTATICALRVHVIFQQAVATVMMDGNDLDSRRLDAWQRYLDQTCERCCLGIVCIGAICSGGAIWIDAYY